MIETSLKGIWIPFEIMCDNNLSDKGKMILAIIFLSNNDKYCFVSNQYIANVINITSNRVSKIISSLKEKKYIDVKLKYKKDSKEIEERQILPIVEMNKGYW